MRNPTLIITNRGQKEESGYVLSFIELIGVMLGPAGIYSMNKESRENFEPGESDKSVVSSPRE